MQPITEFSVRDRLWRLRYAAWFCLYTRWSPRRCWECACYVPTDMMGITPREMVVEDLSCLADS